MVVATILAGSFCVNAQTPGASSVPEATAEAEAQYNLAVKYLRGVDTAVNYKEALKWARKSAESGYAKAYTLLGYAYILGQGVPVNKEEAIRLFTTASELGDEGALAPLSVIEVFDPPKIP